MTDGIRNKWVSLQGTYTSSSLSSGHMYDKNILVQLHVPAQSAPGKGFIHHFEQSKILRRRYF